MRAIVFDTPGEPSVLRCAEVPDAPAAAGEILVKVHATAINRADTLQRRGAYPPPAGASPILGIELAGEVVQATGRWSVGDRVMAVVTGGAYAELAAFPADTAMPIPANLDYVQAAAIPEAFTTAYLNLFTLGRVVAGESVLIHAGASGVGTAAIQLAKAAGARVFVTAGSAAKLTVCCELGADVAIDYTREAFAGRIQQETAGRGVDFILDMVGASYWNANLAALAVGGRMMMIGILGGTTGDLDLGPIIFKALTIRGSTLRRTPHHEKVALATALSEATSAGFASGALRPVIDTILPFAQAAEAHQRMEANANVGKIVLQVT